MNTPKTTPRDFFLNLGAIVALYVAAGALINLWFSVINYYFPDQLAGYFYGNAVAWPISILIILVPILYVLEGMIKRDIAQAPEKSALWIYRWRIYLTLFLAAAFIAGDLVALINVYLNGEIGWRFVLKILTILLVAGSIGKYYFFSLYTTHRFAALSRRIHMWFGLVLVIAAIVLGFIAVGSPAKQRDLRFDSQRVNDLSNIQWQVVNHWQQKEKLPASLAELNDSISYSLIPNDPETDAPYEYSATGALTFRLCAIFGRETQDTEGRGEYYGRGGGYPMYDTVSYPSPIGGMDDNWKHTEGRTCFDRTIDPDKYPPNKPEPAVMR